MLFEINEWKHPIDDGLKCIVRRTDMIYHRTLANQWQFMKILAIKSLSIYSHWTCENDHLEQLIHMPLLIWSSIEYGWNWMLDYQWFDKYRFFIKSWKLSCRWSRWILKKFLSMVVHQAINIASMRNGFLWWYSSDDLNHSLVRDVVKSAADNDENHLVRCFRIKEIRKLTEARVRKRGWFWMTLYSTTNSHPIMNYAQFWADRGG